MNTKAKIGEWCTKHCKGINSALFAATVYFLALFATGFAFGTVRVLVVEPRLGALAATASEVPLMLIAAYFICRWTIRRWRVPSTPSLRWIMVPWFLTLLFLFESLLGTVIFGRTLFEQWTSLTATAGLIGLSAQFVSALLPVFVGKNEL
jgi:hypothetical protein